MKKATFVLTSVLLSVGAAICFSRSYAATINFDDATATIGSEVTNAYVDRGVRFPSRPTIEQYRQGARRTVVAQQGTVSGGPDPLPTTVRCAPLIIEFNPMMRVRQVRMRIFGRHLRFYNVKAFAGDDEVDEFRFIPSGTNGGGFPPIEFYRDIRVVAETSEPSITRVIANPPSDCFDLMVIDDLNYEFDGSVTPIEPVPDEPRRNRFSLLAYEVTQGVMSRLTRAETTSPDTRLMALPGKRLVYLQGRDTAVRFFVGASERAQNDFNARLSLRITYNNGRTTNRILSENTEGGAAVPMWPSEADVVTKNRLLAQRRSRVDQSADFVIPGRALQNAATMRLNLVGGPPDASGSVIGPSIQVPFSGPYQLGLNIARINGVGRDTAIGPALAPGTTTTILQFIEDMYPLSGTVVTGSNGVLTVNTGVTNCRGLLPALDGIIAGTAAAAPVAGVNYWSNMYIARNTLGCGLGWYNRPGALTNASPTTAAHEIGHNIGINHASNGLHGEPGDRESWPYLHGSIGTIDEPRSFSDGVFGAVMTLTTPTSDLVSDWGSWALSVIAPCLGDPASIFPTCTSPDTSIVHDYMSYGPRVSVSPYGNQNWISDINFYRIQRFLQDCTAIDPPHRFFTPANISASFTDSSGACAGAGLPLAGAALGSSAGMSPIDSVVYSGNIESDGKITELRAIRKISMASSTSNQGNGYHLVLRAGNGTKLNSVSFNTRVSSVENGLSVESFVVVTPFEPELATIEIIHEQSIVHSIAVGETQQPIRLLSPVGGESWPEGVQQIRWKADPAAEVYLQYSPDRGKTWLPLGLVGDGQDSLEVDVADLQASGESIVFVSAEHGLNTSKDMSSNTLSIGIAESFIDEDCLGFDPSRLSIKKTNGRWKIVQGNRLMFDFDSSYQEAKIAITAIERYGFNSTCFVGRPDPSMIYLKRFDTIPGGASEESDCIGFDPMTLGVKDEGGRWLLRSSTSQMAIYPSQAEAETALSIIRRYNLTRHCFVGRPNPSFEFWLSDSGG